VKTILCVGSLLLGLLTADAAVSEIVPQSVPEPKIDSVVIDRSSFGPEYIHPKATFFPGKIGLALSGGGARGIAQIGILKAFDEAGWKISYISGTSMGSIIGGLYASGYSAADIEEKIGQIDFSSLFSDSPSRHSLFVTQRTERDQYLFSIRFDGFRPYLPKALAAGQRLTNLLTALTIKTDYSCSGNFDRLPIPFRAVTTDIITGQVLPLASGSLADAMRASMAFPLAFTAVERDGRFLMDGGIVDPIPVDICRDMGADFVIAVNTVSPLLPAQEINTPIDVANQVTSIMSTKVIQEQLAQADYVIQPDLGNLQSIDFKMYDTLIVMGYQAGRQAIAEIEKAIFAKQENSKLPLLGIETTDSSSEFLALKNRFSLKVGDSCQSNSIQTALLAADSQAQFYLLKAETIKNPQGIAIRLGGTLNHTCDQIHYRFTGNTAIPDSQLTRYLPNDSGQVLSLTAVQTGCDSIVALFHQAGYDLAYLQSIYYNHLTGEVTIVIDEGRLRYVDIRGNRRTRDWIIKANYPLRPGQPFNIKKSDKGLANIYGTGFFERVSLDLKPIETGAHLTINVKENKFTQVHLGGHWDDEYQSEMLAELLDDNVFGAGIQMMEHTLISSRRHKYCFSVKADRLSKILFTARNDLYFSRLRRRLFYDDGAPNGYRVEDRLGWLIAAGQQIARSGMVSLEYRLEHIKTTLTLSDQHKSEILSAVALRASIETLNRFPFPDYGHRLDLTLESTSKHLGGTLGDYNKLFGSIEAYWPWNRYFNFRPRIAAGISTAKLPDVEKFYIGGMDSFSGYRTDQLSGDKFFLANWRLRIKLLNRLYLNSNFDWGNVFDNYENIKISEFRSGWGTSLSVDTPLGPFEFGYGKAQERPHRFYLNLGLRF